ncbi:MAG: LCP family protein [Microbacteriaceae bacterium]
MSTPVRNPDSASPDVMTKRAWWLVALNVLIPGSAQVLAGNRKLGRFGLGATLLLWTVLVVLAVLWFTAREFTITLMTNFWMLWAVQLGLAFYAVLWVILTIDTLRLVRLIRAKPGARPLVAGLTVIALVATAGTAAYGAYLTGVGRGTIESIFGGGNVAEPINGRYNIMLLGGDAGPDRMGLRPDSITAVSIDAETGATTMIGIPRNLYRAPFSADSPLLQEYPNGYDCGDECLISYLYTYGEEHPELYPDAESQGSHAGIEAMRDAVEGVTGLTMQYYVLIDMQGFAQLIDALGGVDIDVAERVVLGINGAKPIGAIEVGPQHMDGATALWYARSRYETTDFARMERQRQVQTAILTQFEPANVLSKFQAVAEAGVQVVGTDIPQGMLGRFTELGTKAQSQPITNLELVPPQIDHIHPDYAAVHQMVAALTAPAE